MDNSEEGIYRGMKLMLTNKELMNKYKKKAIVSGERFKKDKTVGSVEELLDKLIRE